MDFWGKLVASSWRLSWRLFDAEERTYHLEVPSTWIYASQKKHFPLNCSLSEFFREEKFFFLLVRIENPFVYVAASFFCLKKRIKINHTSFKTYVFGTHIWSSWIDFEEMQLFLASQISETLPTHENDWILDQKFIFLAKNRWRSWRCF